MFDILMNIAQNKVIVMVGIVIVLDTLLGVLRAIKEHKFNSCFGIDGAIRKVAMLLSIIALGLIDYLLGINIIALVPKEIINIIHVTKVGLCEFFALLFITYEVVSILKNWALCGIWLPTKFKNKILVWLKEMTGELPQ